MSNPSYSEFSSETRASDALTQLALDLYWTWNHSADEVWKRLAPELWELTGNPWLILQAVSQRKLDEITDSAFRGRVEELRDEVKRKQGGTAWFESVHSGSPLGTAAYFSMEYMLSEALPIYSGGLGNVAGDQLKAASDLGVPLIAVGLLYHQGYFRQEIGRYGAQVARYPFNEPGQLPIRPLGDRTAIGSAANRRCLAQSFGSVPGKCRLGGASCICWIPTIPPIFPRIAASPANCTAADRRCGFDRSRCWASAVGGCCGRWVSRRRCAI